MILKNKYFKISTILVVFQQIFIAASTFFIALAGKSLSLNQSNQLLYYIVLFFVTALIAYFLSSCSAYFQIKMRNSIWENYVTTSFFKINNRVELSARKNKQATANWMTGEALSTIEDTSNFSIEFISIYCNVIFTFIVFSMTLGYVMTGAMAISIFVSILLIKILRKKIETLANTIQSTKLEAFINISFLWDSFIFANKDFAQQSLKKFHQKSDQFFVQSEKYTIIEQFVACLPVYLAIPLVIGVMYYMNAQNNLVLGSLVAVLPRSLQLFGNIHSLSLYNSKLLLIKYKLDNLKTFLQRLDKQDLREQIKTPHITITNVTSGTSISIDDFLLYLNDQKVKKGRFLISGVNGAGKSSLLKLIKQTHSDSILVSPDSSLLEEKDSIGSSGENQKKLLESLIAYQVNMFLFDEWDANLDTKNTIEIDRLLNKVSNNRVIIEIRHMP